MSVSQIKEALGNFSIKLKSNTPRDVLDSIQYFGHIAVIPGRMDARVYGDGTLDSARYVGVVRKKKIADNGIIKSDTAATQVTLEGVGMNFWLGDENDKGSIIEEEVNFLNANFSTAVSGLLPPAVTPGTIGGVSGTYSGFHQWQTPRKAIQYVCDTMSQPPDPNNAISTDNSSFEGTAGVGGWTGSSNCAIWDSPSLRSTGTYVSGTGDVSPGMPAGFQADDILLLFIEFDSTNTPTITVSGWTQAGSTIRTGTASGTGTGAAVFWKRATGAESAPTVTDTGDHTSAVIQAWKGCKTSGSPINVISQNWNDSAGTTVTFDQVTTTVNSCAVIHFGTEGVDSATPQYSSWTGAAELGDYANADGTGGGIGIAYNIRAIAGLSTGVSATLSTTSSRTETTLALEPAQVASPTYSYLGTKSMAIVPNSVGALTAKTNGSTNAASVTAGNTYVAYYWVLATGVSCYARVGVDYRDGSYVQQGSASTDTFLALPQNAWTQVSRTFTVPTGAGITKADFLVNLQSNASGDKFYVDNVWIYQNQSETSVSFRVNNRGSLDAGPESNLYVTDPKCILVRQGHLHGEDLRIKAIPGSIGMDQDMEDFSTRLVVLAGSDGLQFSVGEADIGTISPGTNTYKDIHGNPLKLTKMVSESQTTDDNADTRAELALREVINPHRQISLDTADYDIFGSFDIGDYVYCYDPDSGLVDTANEITVRGMRLNPIKLQVTETTWPVTDEYSVAFRAPDGTWYDLTQYIDPDSKGSTKVTIGDFQRTLDSSLQNVQSRLGTNTAPDNLTPGQTSFVTGSFQTVAYLDKTGLARAQQRLVWLTPTNEDLSAVTDGDHYEIQFKLNTGHLYSQTWGAVANLQWGQMNTWGQPVEANVVDWETRQVAWGTNALVINDLACGTAYDYRIRAIDTSNNIGPWSAVETVVAAEDDIPPSQPAAPDVASSLIAVQVTHYLGMNSGGTFNLERDIAYLEVHAQYEPGYTPDDTTKLGNLLANSAMLDAQTPLVGTLPINDTTDVYIKVVAVDKSGNRSQPSPAAQSSATLIDNEHITNLSVSKITAGTMTADWIVSGSIKTGVDGQRLELNPSGLQAFNVDGDLVTNLSSNPQTDGSYMAFVDTSGRTLASINSQGAGSFTSVNTDLIHIEGKDLMAEIINPRGRGVVAYGYSLSNADCTAGSSTGYMELAFTAEANRMYRIYCSSR